MLLNLSQGQVYFSLFCDQEFRTRSELKCPSIDTLIQIYRSRIAYHTNECNTASLTPNCGWQDLATDNTGLTKILAACNGKQICTIDASTIFADSFSGCAMSTKRDTLAVHYQCLDENMNTVIPIPSEPTPGPSPKTGFPMTTVKAATNLSTSQPGIDIRTLGPGATATDTSTMTPTQTRSTTTVKSGQTREEEDNSRSLSSVHISLIIFFSILVIILILVVVILIIRHHQLRRIKLEVSQDSLTRF